MYGLALPIIPELVSPPPIPYSDPFGATTPQCYPNIKSPYPRLTGPQRSVMTQRPDGSAEPIGSSTT
jgi:hypothetical protein